MDRPRDELLARAGLPAQEDRGIGRSDLREPQEELTHRAARSDEPAKTFLRPELDDLRLGGGVEVDGSRAELEGNPGRNQRIADAQRRIITAVRDKNAEEARKWMSKHVRDYQRGYELAGISPDTPISVERWSGS